MYSQLIIRPDIFDRATGNGSHASVLRFWVHGFVRP